MMKKLLPEVCTIQYGFPFDSAKFSDSNGMPLIRIRDVVRGYSETYTTEEYKSEYIVHENDLLIGMDGEFNIAKWGKTPALLNQRVCRLAPKDSIDKDYLFYFMPVALKRIEEKTPFVTVKHLSAKELNKIEIPVLSLEEQRKIAETLSKVDELIAFREQHLAKLDELVKARFVEMFGDPVANIANWPIERLEKHLTIIGGYAFKSDGFRAKGIPVLRIGNINSGYFQPTNMVYWHDDSTLERYKMHPGDLVISLTGTVGKNDYGNVCILGNDYSEYYLNQRNAKLELNETLNGIYLSELLKFPQIKGRLTGISRGIRQANISNKDILSLPILIPPISLQKQFAAFVERVDQQKQTVQQSLEKLELLKKALMQEYFG